MNKQLIKFDAKYLASKSQQISKDITEDLMDKKSFAIFSKNFKISDNNLNKVAQNIIDNHTKANSEFVEPKPRISPGLQAKAKATLDSKNRPINSFARKRSAENLEASPKDLRRILVEKAMQIAATDTKSASKENTRQTIHTSEKALSSPDVPTRNPASNKSPPLPPRNSSKNNLSQTNSPHFKRQSSNPQTVFDNDVAKHNSQDKLNKVRQTSNEEIVEIKNSLRSKGASTANQAKFTSRPEHVGTKAQAKGQIEK